MTIDVPILDNYAGSYRLEYDGKYVTLWGKDTNYPLWGYHEAWWGEQDYEEMVLIPVVVEVRDANPELFGVVGDVLRITY